MSGPRPKPTIGAIRPYVAGNAEAAGFARPIKLSANENALGASPRALEAYRDAAARLHLYPDPAATELREELAAKYDLDPARIVMGTGSDELFSMACQAYLNPGEIMVQPHYAFAAWSIAARAAGADVISAPERNHTVDVDAIINSVADRTRAVFIANPANPTGTSVPFADIARLHAALPEHVLLVIDAAYSEFARKAPGYADGLSLARTAPNVLYTRTFSKLFGLASLRIGWGYASADIIATLNRIRLPFNTPVAAQAAALAALSDDDFAERSIMHAEQGRDALASMLQEFGFEPLPSATNFVAARVAGRLSAAELERALAARGILVRGLSNYDMPDFIRITVGTESEMGALRAALDEIVR